MKDQGIKRQNPYATGDRQVKAPFPVKGNPTVKRTTGDDLRVKRDKK